MLLHFFHILFSFVSECGKARCGWLFVFCLISAVLYIAGCWILRVGGSLLWLSGRVGGSLLWLSGRVGGSLLWLSGRVGGSLLLIKWKCWWESALITLKKSVDCCWFRDLCTVVSRCGRCPVAVVSVLFFSLVLLSVEIQCYTWDREKRNVPFLLHGVGVCYAVYQLLVLAIGMWRSMKLQRSWRAAIDLFLGTLPLKWWRGLSHLLLLSPSPICLLPPPPHTLPRSIC